MEILSIWRRERCCLSVIVLARAAVVSSFRGRRSVGRPSLPKGTRRDTHVFGTGWIWRIWRGSNPIRERFRHCFVTEMRENDARLSRAHTLCRTSHLRLFFAADLLSCRPSVRPSFQEKHVYVATATMCFILFSSLSFPRDDVPASPSSASGRLMHDDGR